MRGTDAARKKLAMIYLVHGARELWIAARRDLSVQRARTPRFYSSSQSGTPIVPKPPEGVTLEDVRPLLGDSDAEVAACAGYLLALLGEPTAWSRCCNTGGSTARTRSEWKKLVYRAIAVIDDPKYIPVLREIYGKLEQYEMSEFYWTIRIMSGPEILAFRKQIRDEVGASQLGQ